MNAAAQLSEYISRMTNALKRVQELCGEKNDSGWDNSLHIAKTRIVLIDLCNFGLGSDE
ncbi:MAG TPA: hypothetical protein VIJ38_07390 [Acidobacteriaceae bacterium]